jgi:ATP-binding cassette subfamily B protein AbcA/BmrA
MRALRLVLRNLDHFRLSFFLIFLTGVISAATSFFIPVLLAEFTKTAFSTEKFIHLSIWVFVLYYITMPLQWVLRKFGEALGSKYGIYLKLKYFKKLRAQSAVQLMRHHSAYVLSMISSVSDGLGHLANEILWGLTYILTNLTLFFYFTARESVAVACSNLVLMAIFVVLSTALAQKIVPIIGRMDKTRASLLERYVDFAGNVLTVKKLGIGSFVESELRSRIDGVYCAIQDVQNFHANRWLVLHSLFGLTYISTIIYMLWEVSQQRSSPAVLILFVASYASVKGNVERLSENLKAVIQMEASISNLEEIMPETNEPNEVTQKVDWNTLELREVEFSYSENSPPIFIPQLTMHRGDKICVMGPSGEGKTTFLNLLAGFYLPQRGQRSLDGTSYSNELESQTAFIAQEAELFNLSLYENLSLGRNIPRSRIENCFERLDLMGWLSKLEAGLDTNIGERGVRVSAGQRQRLNLLRGILLDRSVYLLDEPTSHLDRRTEQRVIDFIREELREKTVVIVSHREAIRGLCTRHFEMANHLLRETSIA